MAYGKIRVQKGELINEDDQERISDMSQGNDKFRLLKNYAIVYNLYSHTKKTNSFKNQYHKRKTIQNMRFIKNLFLSYTDYLLSNKLSI